jgi:hypothetical protein
MYQRNLKTLAICQARYDRMEPPEYWEEEEFDEDEFDEDEDNQ